MICWSLSSQKLIAQILDSISREAIVIHLSGHVQHNDRLAMREIARQLTLQTGAAVGSELGNDIAEGEDDFTESDEISLPPTSQLATIISALPTLARPTIVVLE